MKDRRIIGVVDNLNNERVAELSKERIENRILKPKCKCGHRIIEVDGHYICEKYFEDIKYCLKKTQEELDYV